MNKEIEEYFREELENISLRYNDLNNLIREKQIEANLIEKKIHQIVDYKDDTVEVLYPGERNHSDTNEVQSLLDRANGLRDEVTFAQKELKDVINKQNRLKLLIDEIRLQNHNDDLPVFDNDLEQNEKNQIKFQEVYREKISRDIHDGVVQNLSALLRKMEFITKLINQDVPRAKLEIENSKLTLKETIQELRNIIYKLRPMSLNDLGFEAAFLNFCEKIKHSYDGIFSYGCSMKQQISDVDFSINILRIVKELCSNSIKYSNGNQISTEISTDNDMVTIKHKDNGNGFHYFDAIGEKDNHTGFGLLMLNERVRLYHGRIEFNDEDGSSYIITMPLENMEDRN